ncbi:MAG: 2OG-Fe(II) oxygenase [Alphaproteobacteria bacterium]
MSFLDYDRLNAIDAAAFRSRRPYPWINPLGLLTEEGHATLRAALPDVSQFDRVFGKKRMHGQRSHDRYILEYDPNLAVDDAWRAFIGELSGEPYVCFLKRMFGCRSLRLRYHWHYTPKGCSVSPHCDAKDKFGSHIFYFNTADDWDPSWGGETVILDDGGRLSRNSAPAFDDFDRVIESEAMGNTSLLFTQTGNSWHGVREITCPDGALRKVFIVVVERPVLGLRRQVALGLRRMRGLRS